MLNSPSFLQRDKVNLNIFVSEREHKILQLFIFTVEALNVDIEE